MEYAIYLQTGLGMSSYALAASQAALGTFFCISGFHKLFNAQRRAKIRETMHNLHIPLPEFNRWFVPSVEFLGGLAVLSGVLAPLAASGLFVICLVAVLTDGLGRIPQLHPIDAADWVDDLLYLPETLYLLGLAIIIAAGPGYTII